MAKKTKPQVSDDLMEIISDTPFKDSAPKSHQEELGVLNMQQDNSRPFMEPQDPKILGVLHMDDALSGAEPKPDFKEITLKFTKGLVGDEFQAKDGNTYREIKIPNKDPNDNRPWQSFVAPSNRIHEDQYSSKNMMWLKLPEDGQTTVKRDIIIGDRPDGKHEWKREMEKLPNKDIKKMLDAARPRESFKDKLADKQAQVRANNEERAMNPIAKDHRNQQTL
jgi:hypothetical protein